VFYAILLVGIIGVPRFSHAHTGGYLSLTSSGDRAEASTTIYPTTSTEVPLTVEAWIYPTSAPPDFSSYYIVSDDAYRLAIWAAPGGTLYAEFGVWDSTCGNYQSRLFDSIALDTWTHIAGYYDPNSKNVFAAIDGTWSAGTLNGNSGFCSTGSEHFTVGGEYGSSSDTFLGGIDEVRVSDIDRYPVNFTPAASFTCDGDTRVLFHFESSTLASDPGCGSYILTEQGNPTSVDLLDFSAERTGDGVRLAWRTGSELDCSTFEILRCDRSISGCSEVANHRELAGIRVPCEDNPTGAEYQVIDATADAQTPYSYYLRQYETTGDTRDYPTYLGHD